MDELEDRINAIELLLIEFLAHEPPLKLQTVMDKIREGLPGMDQRETNGRRHALVLLDDALRRSDEFTSGYRIASSDLK